VYVFRFGHRSNSALASIHTASVRATADLHQPQPPTPTPNPSGQPLRWPAVVGDRSGPEPVCAGRNRGRFDRGVTSERGVCTRTLQLPPHFAHRVHGPAEAARLVQISDQVSPESVKIELVGERRQKRLLPSAALHPARSQDGSDRPKTEHFGLIFHPPNPLKAGSKR
jgi:hypothetical protein